MKGRPVARPTQWVKHTRKNKSIPQTGYKPVASLFEWPKIIRALCSNSAATDTANFITATIKTSREHEHILVD
jgi:hypothetical protein